MAKLLGIGNATLDIIHLVDGYPDENHEMRCRARHVRRGGNTANTLVVLSQLGIACSWAGTLVDNKDGALIRDDLLAHDIDTGHCHYAPGGSVPVSTILLNIRNGSRTIIHHRDLAEYSARNFESIELEPFDWLHFEGRNVADTRLMLERVRRLRPTVPLSIEIEKPRDGIASLFAYADVLLFSRVYAEALGYRDPLSLLYAMQPQCPQALLFCSWGDAGAAALDRQGTASQHEALAPAEVIDTLGAGDTFNAGVISACLDRLDPAASLARACRLAGKKCGQRGFDNLGGVVGNFM
ncbi:MAG: PfkB family carbohydrate kinase [Gammaproteobacteria bacterium]